MEAAPAEEAPEVDSEPEDNEVMEAPVVTEAAPEVSQSQPADESEKLPEQS